MMVRKRPSHYRYWPKTGFMFSEFRPKTKTKPKLL